MPTQAENDQQNALALASVCEQRQRAQLLNVPPIRLELQPSPYPSNTQQQLNMRRKIEILKYSGTGQNTKTNGLTKAEKWAQLVNGNNRRNSISASLYTNNVSTNGVYDCSGDEYIPTPTSSCDVPGPVMILQYDDSVPLYNYATNINSYAIINESNTILWKTYPIPNTTFYYDYDSAKTPLLLLTPIYIQPLIDQHFYEFTMNVPIGLSVSYDESSDISMNTSYTISINRIDMSIYYNSTLVLDTSYNMSSQAIGNLPYDNSFNSLSFKVTDNTKPFVAELYVGNFVTNPAFTLPTEPGYIYDIKLKFEMSTTLPLNRQKMLKINAISDISDSIRTSTNCTILSIPTISAYVPFYLTGS